MPNSITFPKEYLETIDEALVGQTFASRYQTGGEEFVSNRTVLVPDITFPGATTPNDYDGFVTKNDIKLGYTPYQLAYDKQEVFQVDAVDDIDTAGLMTVNAVTQYDRLHFAPWLDQTFFGDVKGMAGGAQGTAAAITKTNVKAAFREARTHLRKHGLAGGDVYMSSTALAALEDATNREWSNEGTITDSVGRYNDFDLFEDAGERLPDGIDMLVISGGVATVRYVLKRAVTYTFAPGSHTGGDNWLTQIRRVFGVVGRRNKRPGIYVAGANAAVADLPAREGE
jgi:hypothetical protein